LGRNGKIIWGKMIRMEDWGFDSSINKLGVNSLLEKVIDV